MTWLVNPEPDWPSGSALLLDGTDGDGITVAVAVVFLNGAVKPAGLEGIVELA